MRDPVGGSVEFHFVPILKLISTLLIMGVFDDEDVTQILKMIDPTVFSVTKAEEPAEDNSKVNEEKEKVAAVKDVEQEAQEEEEFEDYGFEEEEEEEEGIEEEELEETEPVVPHEEAEEETDQVNGEKGAEETEKESKPVDAGGESKEELLEQGLFQMKLPESVKLQVLLVNTSETNETLVCLPDIVSVVICFCCLDVYSAAVFL